MRIDLFGKYVLKCPKCGEIYDRRDGYFKCLDCKCELLTEDECIKRGCYRDTPAERKATPIVTCPYCHSINTRKITTVDLLFTMRPGKMFREWHCYRCGSDF